MSIVVNIVQYTSIIRIIIDRFIIFSGSKAISVPLNLVKKSWTSRARKITDNDLLREKSFRIGHFFKNFTSFSFWSFIEAIFFKMFCNFSSNFNWNSFSSSHRQKISLTCKMFYFVVRGIFLSKLFNWFFRNLSSLFFSLFDESFDERRIQLTNKTFYDSSDFHSALRNFRTENSRMTHFSYET